MVQTPSIATSKRPARRRFGHPLLQAFLGSALLLFAPAPDGRSDDAPPLPSEASPAAVKKKTLPKNTSVRPFHTTVVRGRVVWLAEAMKRRYGIQSVPDATKRTLALETPSGELRLLIEDSRGHAFRVDERLRKMDLKLLVREYERAPVLQVVRVFQVLDGVDFEIDYWCEICAIAMYELKACDCCQGPIELRKRRQASPPLVLKASSSR